MKTKPLLGWSMIIMMSMLTIAGCGNIGNHRSPEQWLSLSYSGLAATDQYQFSGSMSMKTEDGISLKPEIFKGKVVDHQQLTLQTNNKYKTVWNPLNVLETLNESNAGVKIIKARDNPNTVTLLITEHANVSKEKWEQRLHQKLDQLGTHLPSVNEPYRKEWMEELSRSRKQLDSMLSSMTATTEYELVIDRKKLVPLKMDEQTSFRYLNNQRTINESRHTSIQFQSFKGATSEAVQQMGKRVTMD